VVRDVEGKAIPRCTVTVGDGNEHEVSFVTTASGRAIFFPHAEGFTSKDFVATARCADAARSVQFSLNDDDDGIVDLKLAEKRPAITVRPVDVAFVLDTTGSMSEEIAAVKSTIQKVAKSLGTREIKVRVGLVEYKDKGDDFVTKLYPMTTDLDAFQRKISGIFASGGGDLPEHMTAGLHDALTKLDWNKEAVARMAFIIGDAPPHLDYDDNLDYVKEMKDAAHRGVQLFTIAASGMDTAGQIVWRQMAQYTGGTEMFVLRGGAGRQSTGGGDPLSSCGGTQQQYASGNLDELITRKIQRELEAIDKDPMRIPGLKKDESAKPCSERIALD
jgi:Mg-chelatase subunit ChlD